MNLFDGFDFELLDDVDFREDSVREELVIPLLKALGYSASLPNRIIRSRPLEHPFVHIGTVRKGITIIPDYLLQRDGVNAWILDAKAPNENIETGKNVEQAYSYAIHRDIRVAFYALCNGRKLIIFHVSQLEPVLNISLSEISTVWPSLLDLFGCKSAWINGLRPDFRPDFGLALTKAGLALDADGRKIFHMFTSVDIFTAGKVSDTLYTLSAMIASVSVLGDDGDAVFMISFDFEAALYNDFLSGLEPLMRDRVSEALSRQPYHVMFVDDPKPNFGLVVEIGDEIMQNEDESYRPFVVKQFL